MKQLILILTAIFLSSNIIFGQISEFGIPYSFDKNINESIATFYIDASLTDLESTTSIDFSEGDTAIISKPTIGKLFLAGINSQIQGTWENLENGDSLWRIKINSNTGTFMMLLFNEFYLPEGTSLFVYSNDKRNLLGKFTSSNNNLRQKFITSPIKSNSIVVEYFKPSYVRTKEKLNIQSVGLISKSFDEILPETFGASGPCMINAKCSEYENWCNQRRSIALIINVQQAEGTISTCTGSLLSNERRDGKPFFLTAFHCLDVAPSDNSIDQSEKDDTQDWLFIFNYQAADCTNPIDEPGYTYSMYGASYIKSHKNSDYALLQLNQKPPKNYNVYYNGWNNNDEDMSNSGVCIHHPNGDIKKISEWEKKASPKANFWKVKWIAGSTAGGSSGAPLFNASGFVVGQNFGSNNKPACDDSKRNFFGRFDKSWHNFGLNSELNPNGIHNGSNQQYIAYMIGDETCKDDWYFSNVSNLHTSADVNFFDQSTIGTRQYDGVYNAKHTIEAENVLIHSGTSVIFEAGNYVKLKTGFTSKFGSNFKAKIGACEFGCGNGFKMLEGNYSKQSGKDMFIVQNEQVIEDEIFEQKIDKTTTQPFFTETITILPNPNNGSFEIVLPFNFEEIDRVQVINQTGQLVFEKKSNIDEKINISNPKSGLYFVIVISRNKVFTQKLIIK